MAGSTADVSFGTTYYFKDLGLSSSNVNINSDYMGPHWKNGYNGQGRMQFRQIWSGGAMNGFSDGTKFTRFNWGRNGVSGGNDDGDVMTIYVDRPLKVSLVNGDSTVSVHYSAQSKVVVEYPADSGNIYGQYIFNRLDTRQTITFNAPANSRIYWGRIGPHFSAYYSYKFEVDNNPPSQPGAFTKQPITNSINLAGEVVDLSWGAASDSDGDGIKYTLEFFNGSSWNVITDELLSNFYNYKLPKLNITNAQFRVKAVDEKGAESSYRLSNSFKIYEKLLLIQDGDIIKTYKNGEWQTI